MNLYLLEPVKDWKPWCNKCFGMVIRAKNETVARELAELNGGDEIQDEIEPWLNPKQTTCVQIITSGEEEVILRNYRDA